MKDPGNPRAALRGNEAESTDEVRPLDFVDGLATVVRCTCLLGVSLLLAIGAYYAVVVFIQLGTLIRDPASATNSVTAIAELINADRLTFQPAPENRIEPGSLVAFISLLLCYALWIWIPMQLIYTCGRVLLIGFGPRKEKANETTPK